MPTSRRDFLRLSTGPSANIRSVAPLPDIPKADTPLRILVLGGTSFLGVHQVNYALARGHQLTLFNRGRTNTELFPGVKKLRGDRNDDLTALQGYEWDVVIDNSATVPRWVRQSAELLRHAAKQYMYVSSISVFSDNSIVGADESAPVAQLEDPTVEQITGDTYGGMKALCEKMAQDVFGDQATVVRPGLIVGPMDVSDRFTYWPVRIDRGGEVIAPGDPTDPVQIVDGRDLGEWMIRMAEENHTGVYNATGPAAPMSIAEMLYGIRAVTNANVNFTWIDADSLQEHEIRPWTHMPTWIPPREGMEGFSRVDCSKAIGRGLTFRPLADTALDTLRWWNTLPEERRSRMRVGIPAEREREVLAAWHNR